jgi:Holliday junction resolvase RusA-like endonuclease
LFNPDNPFAAPAVTSSASCSAPAGLSVWVAGLPKPQGSKTYLGRGRMRESSKGLPSWRADVRAALLATGVRVPGAVSAGLEFVMPRPQRARPGQPADRIPDLDKLTRGVLDAMTSAGVIEDDARVVNFHRLHKRLAEPGEPTGCRISVRRWAACS